MEMLGCQLFLLFGQSVDVGFDVNEVFESLEEEGSSGEAPGVALKVIGVVFVVMLESVEFFL